MSIHRTTRYGKYWSWMGEVLVMDVGSSGFRWGKYWSLMGEVLAPDGGKYWSWMGEVLAPDGGVLVLDGGSTGSRYENTG